GDIAGARTELERIAAALRDSGMTRIGMIRDILARSRIVWLAHAAVRAPDDAELRRALARGCARQRRRQDPTHRGEAWIHEATLRSLTGEPDAVRRAWRAAAIHLDEHGQAAQLAAVHLRLSSCTRGREAAEYEARG